MPAPLRVTLTEEQDQALFALRSATDTPQRTKDRAEALRLIAHGWNVEQVATFLNWAPQTVRITIHRWQQRGLFGLWDAPGRGRKPSWQEDDFTYLEQTLQQEPRTYNGHQLAQKLAQERHIVLSADRIRRVLKKRTSVGNAPATHTAINKTQSRNKSKQKNLL